MTRRRALIACANHWNSPITVGDHHLARDLVRRGWEVAFVSNPITPFHVGRARANRDRFECYFAGGQRDLDGRLWAYVPGTLFPLGRGRLGSRPCYLSQWFRATFPPVVRRVREEGFGQVDLLYIREAKQAFWLDQLESRAVVYRVADWDAGFPGFSPGVRELERRIAERADLVVHTAANLRGYVEDLGARHLLELPNGVDFQHFAAPRPKPTEYEGDPRPIAVYVGSIDVWLDRRLIEFVVRSLPEVRFVFIGPGDLGSLGDLAAREYRNLELLGPRPFEDVPAYLQHATLGVIPFDVENHRELVESVQPLKLLEYLACGLPVVSTDWSALAAMGAPIQRCRDPRAFVEAVREAIFEPDDRRERRVRFAEQQAWPARFDRLLNEVGLG